MEANHRVQGWMWVSTSASRSLGRRPAGGQGQNRPGENPPSGIAGGPAETWTKVERGPHLASRKSECWKRSTYSCARRSSIPTFCCMLRGRRMITIFHDKDDPEAQAKFERWRQTTSHGYFINYRSRSNLMIHRVGCPHDTPWHQKWGSLTRTKKMCSSSEDALAEWARANAHAPLKRCSDCM